MPTSNPSKLVAIGLAGAALAGVFLASYLVQYSRIGRVDVTPYNPEFANTRGALNVMMAAGDGQGYAILARDPLLRSSPIPAAETAYLAQRPVVSIVARIVALGDPRRVPVSIAVSSVLGAAVATFGFGALLARHGRNPWWALGVGILPGAIGAVSYGGAETWGLGLSFLGLALWPEKPWKAAAVMAVGALCRETYLLVPAALGVWELTRRRIAWPLLLPVGAYAAWVAFVYARIGAWPWDSHGDKLDVPFRGIVLAVRSWGPETTVNILTLASIAIALILPIRKAGWTRAVALAFVALAAVMGQAVWARWEDFGRVLLPAWAIGLFALLVRSKGADPARSEVPGRS